MIISTACKRELPEFVALMKKTDAALNADARSRENYYIMRSGKKLESDVCDVLTKCAIGTPFEGTVKLVSGASFPDIVAKKMFGVEVKSTEKNHWQSIGSSILESTRDQNVERIFMTFGKLGIPVEFLSKPYEDCLSEIVVTHYPRYRIDMQLQEKHEKTIFEKMAVDYDDIRKMDNPVPIVSSYYKAQLNPGESLWWAADEVESSAPMTARLWTALSHEEKEKLTVQGYALFPEVLSAGNNKKYNRYALWMATQKGVINTNIRDSFSAGGQVEMPSKGGVIVKMPAAFGRIKKYKELIQNTIEDSDAEVLAEYWEEEISDNRIKQWCRKVATAADSGVGYATAWSVLSNIFIYINDEQPRRREKTWEPDYRSYGRAAERPVEYGKKRSGTSVTVPAGAKIRHVVFGKGQVVAVEVAFKRKNGTGTIIKLPYVKPPTDFSVSGGKVQHNRFGIGEIVSFEIAFSSRMMKMVYSYFEDGSITIE